MRRTSELLLILFTATLLSFCSMGYELLIARFLASITSDSVTSQSVTVGCFLMALGLGAYVYTKIRSANRWQLLGDIEIIVSVVAIVALPCLAILSLFISRPLNFILLSQVATFAIGFLSGLELPALIDLAKPLSKRAFGSVLAVNYLGSLFVSFLLPMYFLPRYGLYLTTWFFAVLTSVAAVVAFFRAYNFRPHIRIAGLLIIFLAPPFAAKHLEDFEQFYLKSYYFVGPAEISVKEFKDTLRVQASMPPILRFSTPYQDIDIVSDNIDLPGTERNNDFHLFIDQRNQFGSDSEIIYHDTMVHGSINMTKHVPKKVLLIGGGDGLISRHLLTYPEIESITQVELDAKMIDLSNGYPLLRKLNGGSLRDPRVHLELADGFSWLRQNREKFDAIFIDLPHPVSVDLSRLYSVEFYKFVRAHLNDDGFMCFDFPFDGLIYLSQQHKQNIETIKSILKAVDEAGFHSRSAIGSWESFLVATPQKKDLHFDYAQLGSRISMRSTLNMARVRVPEPTAETDPNSIFKPVTIKVMSVRGN